jgi:hypothetical protein
MLKSVDILSLCGSGISDLRMPNTNLCQWESSLRTTLSRQIRFSQAVVSAASVCRKHAGTSEILTNDFAQFLLKYVYTRWYQRPPSIKTVPTPARQ